MVVIKGTNRTGQRDGRTEFWAEKRFKGTTFIAAKKEKSSAEGAKINL